MQGNLAGQYPVTWPLLEKLSICRRLELQSYRNGRLTYSMHVCRMHAALHNRSVRCSFGEMQLVEKPLPCVDLLRGKTGPAVGQGEEEIETVQDGAENDDGSNPGAAETAPGRVEGSSCLFGNLACYFILLCVDYGGCFLIEHRIYVEYELNESTSDQARGKMCGKVMVQEKLATHKIKGEIMGCPADKEEAGTVVQPRASA